MSEDELILTHQDGSQIEVEDPFRGMRSTYDALRVDPAAMPELSDESRAAILAEIANRTAPAAYPLPAPKAYFVTNRHDRRKAAAITRRKKRERSNP